MKFENILTFKNCEDGGLRKRNILKKSDEINPLITIITATYNSENYLDECLNSLFKQSYKNYEHLVIDGGSTDNTVNILKKMMIKQITGAHKKMQEFMMLSIKD